MRRILSLQLVFRTNRIESNWVRFEFDSIESRIEFKRFEFERIEFERFGFDSDSIRFRDYHVTLHKFPKKEIFVFAKIEKLRYTRSHKFPKKEFFCWSFSNSIRSDSIRFDSIRFDSIWLESIRFDLNSIQIRSIRIRFEFDSIQTESNFINSDSICRSRIWIVCGTLLLTSGWYLTWDWNSD